jgi:LPXTG-site transpeptidase (sortase) family protein
MFRDITICLLSTLNILIFSFIILNGQALKTVDAFAEPDVGSILEFDQITTQVQQSISKQQWIREKKLRSKPECNTDCFVPRNDNALPPSTAGRRNDIQPSTLSIPSLNLTAPIVFHDHLSSEEAQKKLEEGAISLNEFIPPSEAGQTIIFGHSSDYPWRNNPYANVFTLLPELQAGDVITIHHENSIYKYEVVKSVITPTDLEGVIESDPSGNELILSTCYPIGFFSKRFNVVAKPK